MRRRTSGCTGAGAAGVVGMIGGRCAGPVNLALGVAAGRMVGVGLRAQHTLERMMVIENERAGERTANGQRGGRGRRDGVDRERPRTRRALGSSGAAEEGLCPMAKRPPPNYRLHRTRRSRSRSVRPRPLRRAGEPGVRRLGDDPVTLPQIDV